jgi:hypothetical protein
MNVHMYIRVYVQTYIHKHNRLTHTHTCIHTYIHTYKLNTCIHTFVYIHVYIHTYTYIYTRITDLHTCGASSRLQFRIGGLGICHTTYYKSHITNMSLYIKSLRVLLTIIRCSASLTISCTFDWAKVYLKSQRLRTLEEKIGLQSQSLRTLLYIYDIYAYWKKKKASKVRA